jgi:hypothetical protein
MDDVVFWSAHDRDDARRLGTRFRVFPQPPFVPGYERPEVVWISSPLGTVGPGPSDQRLYVVDPIIEKAPYEYPYLPPFTGDLRPPVLPGSDGHFDHLEAGTREFAAAHVFACVRRVLDICESYLGREIPWFFAPVYDRLEIVPHLHWNNAQSGFGFLEMGEDDSMGEPFPFALNFDAIAHETGHLVLFGMLGLPEVGEPGPDFLAYHEAASDCLALLALLHFDTAADRILRRSRGNLLIENELDYLAELSVEKSVRTASHSLRMSDVGFQLHDRSKPFTGAVFDSLVEIYHLLLVERGVVHLDTRLFGELRHELSHEEIEREVTITAEEYEWRHFAAKSALIDARDMIGEVLMSSWALIDPVGFTLREGAEAFLVAVQSSRARRFVDRIHDNFAWRELI